MKVVSYLENSKQLEVFKNNNVIEVILGTRELNRFSSLKIDDMINLAKEAKALEFKVVFEWDILMTEDVFCQKLSKFKEIELELFDAIRVQDPGALEYCLNNTVLPIQYICETGNHNILGLKTWRNYIGDRLDRLVLSSELSRKVLSEIIEELSCDIETLIFGEILLFYSPRSLVTSLVEDEDKKELLENMMISGSSEESPHKGFPILENRHGTFMFYTKFLSLLTHFNELSELGVTHSRLDLRREVFEFANQVFSTLKNNDEALYSDLKAAFPKPLIKGFYQSNRSDVLFKKLKNYRLLKEDDQYLGEVIGVEKDKLLCLKLSNGTTLTQGQEVRITTPEGKVVDTHLKSIRDLQNNIIESSQGEIMLMNFVKGILPKSIITRI